MGDGMRAEKRQESSSKVKFKEDKLGGVIGQ